MHCAEIHRWFGVGIQRLHSTQVLMIHCAVMQRCLGVEIQTLYSCQVLIMPCAIIQRWLGVGMQRFYSTQVLIIDGRHINFYGGIHKLCSTRLLVIHSDNFQFIKLLL